MISFELITEHGRPIAALVHNRVDATHLQIIHSLLTGLGCFCDSSGLAHRWGVEYVLCHEDWAREQLKTRANDPPQTNHQTRLFMKPISTTPKGSRHTSPGLRRSVSRVATLGKLIIKHQNPERVASLLDRAAQHTLFACQLWHVKRAKALAGVIRSYERADDKRFLAYLKRQLRQHEKFINAITPFVRLPL